MVKSAERIRLLADDVEAMPYTLLGEATASAPRATVSTWPRLDDEREEDAVEAIPP